MATDINTLLGGNTGTRFTIKDYFYKYLSYWPLFLVSLAICTTAGLLYNRYTTPIYKVSTLILVKGDQSNPNTSEDLVRTALEGGVRPSNLDNEMQLLTSGTLMERVTSKNDFNISYYKLANIRKIDLYKDVPFELKLLYAVDSAYASPVDITLSNINNNGGNVQYGPDKQKKTIKFNWDQSFYIGMKNFILRRSKPLENLEGEYLINWSPVKDAAARIASNYYVEVLDKKTSIIKLELSTENLKRGQDILNAVYREFNLSDLEEKNATSEKTRQFIDDRLAAVSTELNGVEGNQENYQVNNQLINVASQSSQSFDNANDVSKNLTNVNVQQQVVQMIEDYFNAGGDNEGKLVPSSMGINDATLATLITKYNELQLKKEKDLPSLTTNSPILKDISNQISSLRGSILENLQNIKKNLHLQENSLQQKNSQYREFLTSLPHKERVIQEIKRKQSISEGLYLYLLQKREQTSISASSSNVSIYKQIDQAKEDGPVMPNKRNIQLYSIVFGLLIPIGVIRLRDMLNDKVMHRGDITAITQIPLIGELAHIPDTKTAGIVVQSRDLIAEQFRLLRTNLSYLTKKEGPQVIMVTSSSTNEGKSLISLNLAAVLAAPGSKVALLEFDLRLPTIAKMANLTPSKGIAAYLKGEVTDLREICYPSEEVSALHIYPCGAETPSNAADLLLSERLTTFIDKLKKQYDYIVVDTSPAGLVSDAFILGKFSDMVLYIVRQNHTEKKQIDFVTEIYKLDKLPNLCIVFNDVKAGNKYGPDYVYKGAYEYYNGPQKKQGLFKRLLRAGA